MAQLNPQAPNAILELIQSPRIQLTPFDPAEGTFGQWLQLFDEACISARVRDEPMENDVILPAHNHKRAYFLSSVGRRAYAVLQINTSNVYRTSPIRKLSRNCQRSCGNILNLKEPKRPMISHFQPGTNTKMKLSSST